MISLSVCCEFTMDPLSISRIHYEFTMCFDNSPCFSRIHYGFINFFFANSLWLPYLFLEFTMNSRCVSRIHYLFRKYTIFVNTLSRFHYEFTISFTNLLWIHYLFHEFTMDRYNSVGRNIPRMHSNLYIFTHFLRYPATLILKIWSVSWFYQPVRR